jgi:hypothetical protein
MVCGSRGSGATTKRKTSVMNNKSRKPSLSLLLALLALVVALGGTAGALPGKGSIQGNDIKKNSIKSKHVKNDQLVGADIRESSLAEVPSAAAADNGATRVSFRGAVGFGPQVIFDGGGLVIRATCVSEKDLAMTMESTVDNAAVFVDTQDHDGQGENNGDGSENDSQQGDFDAGQPVPIDGFGLHADDGQGLEVNYSNPDGTEVFLKLHNWLASGVATAPAPCFVGGVGFVV